MANDQPRPDDESTEPDGASPPPAELVEASPVTAAPASLPQPHFGWAILWWVILLGAQLVAGMVFAVTLVVLAMIDGAGPNDLQQSLNESMQENISWMLLLGTATTFLTAVVIVVAHFRGRTLSAIGWRGCSPWQWAITILLVLPLAILASEVVNWATEFLPQMGGMEMFANFGDSPWPIIFIAACLLPGLGEEIFFRGFLSRGFTARYGLIVGPLLATLMFALMHGFPIQICATFALGLVIQYIFMTTRSLPAAIVAHVLNNTLAFAVMKYGQYFPVPGFSYGSEEVLLHTPLPLVLAALACAAALLVCLYQSRTRWVTPDGSLWAPGYFATELPPQQLAARPQSKLPHWIWLIVATLAYGGMIVALFWARGSVVMA